MGELGADLMLVCSNTSAVSLGSIDRAAQDLRDLEALAAERGIRVGYEALAWGKHVNDHRDAWEIVRRADHANIGLMIHFIDQTPDLASVWETEFVPVTDDTAVVEAGLLRIDHIGQTMPYDEMLSWLLFYTSIFRTGKSPMLDIIDPSGVVRSQAIESEDGRLRLTLNGAENTLTFAGRFIAENLGSSVQHLAFATADIFVAAAALTANGFETLRISPNYFDDVEARFGLDPDLADRLRAANILYDRDEQGEYFQLYSPNYGEGFFFEIIERRGGYRGYGAPNAPFRIAAQKRHLRPKGIPRN